VLDQVPAKDRSRGTSRYRSASSRSGGIVGRFNVRPLAHEKDHDSRTTSLARGHEPDNLSHRELLRGSGRARLRWPRCAKAWMGFLPAPSGLPPPEEVSAGRGPRWARSRPDAYCVAAPGLAWFTPEGRTVTQGTSGRAPRPAVGGSAVEGRRA